MIDTKSQKLVQIIIKQFLEQKHGWKLKTYFIDIENMGVVDIAFLCDFSKRNLAQNVTEVNLAHNIITDFSSLMCFPLLRYVNVRGNDLKYVPELPAAITNLDAAYNYLSDIEIISRYQDLTWLDIGDSEVVDITPLTALSKLEGVDLKANHIKDISPLRSLTTLKEVDLRGNQITDVSPLGELTNLEWLAIDGANIAAGDRRWLIQALPNCKIAFAA